MPSATLQIGGVTTTETHRDKVTVLNWILSLGFTPDNVTFQVQEATPQNHLDPELLQQRLRNTVWTGDYRTINNLYFTQLHFKSVQGGVQSSHHIETIF